MATVPKTKALEDKNNEVLRRALRDIITHHFSKPPKGAQGRAAVALGVSGSFLSEVLSGSRGAGPELLRGIARYRPLEVLQALEIDPKTVLALWSDSGEEAGVLNGAEIPDALRRAARAAIELLHCTADEARKAAESAWAETTHHEDADADWWLLQLRERLPRRKSSHVRRRKM